ncbi:MAG: Asp-tRNA(Asn)/Glu-tRNA(Gln) amidotransferase subunit GatB [Candidatus Saganbacteria bacterium]|nr:Asp-tRNA(Asn)/Glu-tRNA(Gln) amidotransferase subunit GatB [Candidatus Saganbacteria bacterium]
MKHETVIGLEVHAQLLTESKMFCSCPNKFGAPPNTNICPVCTGQPGSLPVTNKKAVELAIKTALALNCRIEPSSVFARKHYFYPDLPKDYQISQYEQPLATGGWLEIEIDGQVKKIGITRVHLEEDAGKLVHVGAARIMGAEESLVDFNRTGTPLMEIVSEPDLRSPREAAAYTETLANLLRYLGVCDAKMEEGSLRCDANLSLRPAGETKFGTKTEVKNMNSFRAIEKALAAEEKRHAEVLAEGGQVVQETRFFDDVTETTSGMRGKEFAHDYRYFPEPDLVPLEPPAKWTEEIKNGIGELPRTVIARYMKEYELSREWADFLVYHELTGCLEGALKIYKTKPFNYARWLIVELPSFIAELNKEAAEKSNINKAKSELPHPWVIEDAAEKAAEDNYKKNIEVSGKSLPKLNLTPAKLAEIEKLIDGGTLSYKIAKTVLFAAIKTGKELAAIIAQQGLTQISDEGELLKVAREVVKNNPRQAEQYKGGKEAVMMFFVGQMMKATKGRANPELAAKMLKQALS